MAWNNRVPPFTTCDQDHGTAHAFRLSCPMVRITIERRWEGFTFLVNGRDDLVADPVWGVTMFETEYAALETAVRLVRALQRAGTAANTLT